MVCRQEYRRGPGTPETRQQISPYRRYRIPPSEHHYSQIYCLLELNMLCDCSQIKAARKPLNGVEDSSVRVWRVGCGVRVKGQGSRVKGGTVTRSCHLSHLSPPPFPLSPCSATCPCARGARGLASICLPLSRSCCTWARTPGPGDHHRGGRSGLLLGDLAFRAQGSGFRA